MAEVTAPPTGHADQSNARGCRAHLDCTSLETTLRSLGHLVSRDPEWLRRALKAFDADAFVQAHPRSPLDPTERVFSQVIGGDPRAITPASITWLHTTRVSPHATFAEGILPLDRALTRVWSVLRAVAGDWVTDAAWSAFQHRPDGRGAFQYRLKSSDRLHWGPYALLVREAALRPQEIGNHDYLGTPEIVEDICQCFEDQFGRDLLGAYQAVTRPCLVHFVSDAPRPDTVPVALAYACAALRKEPLTHWGNTCYDGEGRAVPADQIVRIEFLETESAREQRGGR